MDKTVELNLQNEQVFVCFKNKEGILVFNRMMAGSVSVVVNEHDIAIGVAGHAELELSGFTFGELVDNIDDVREIKGKIESLSDNDFETIKHIIK
jgi:hypothetical protein